MTSTISFLNQNSQHGRDARGENRPGVRAPLSVWPDIMAAISVTELAIEATDAIMAGGLRWNHRDPFDRMIVAQAARRGLTIATRDADILDAVLTPTLKV